MTRPPRVIAAVVVIVFRGERLLALRRSPAKDAAPGEWEALSGRIEPGEQPLQAAEREAREESGLAVAVVPRPITAYLTKRNADDMLVVAYRAESAAGEFVLSEEHDLGRWMTLDEFARTCRFPGLVEAARLAAALRAGP